MRLHLGTWKNCAWWVPCSLLSCTVLPSSTWHLGISCCYNQSPCNLDQLPWRKWLFWRHHPLVMSLPAPNPAVPRHQTIPKISNPKLSIIIMHLHCPVLDTLASPLVYLQVDRASVSIPLDRAAAMTQAFWQTPLLLMHHTHLFATPCS